MTTRGRQKEEKKEEEKKEYPLSSRPSQSVISIPKHGTRKSTAKEGNFREEKGEMTKEGI